MRIVFLVLFFMISRYATCQDVVGVNSSIKLKYYFDEHSIILDKETENRIAFEDLSKLFKLYPQSIVSVKEEDVDGKPKSFFFVKNPNLKSKSKISTVKIKRKDVKNNIFNLSEINDKYTVLILQLQLQLPMININAIKEVEQVAKKNGCVSVILTATDMREAKAFSEKHNFSSVIIPNAHNLMKTLESKRFPVFLVLDKEKSIIKSVKYYYEVEEELAKLD